MQRLAASPSPAGELVEANAHLQRRVTELVAVQELSQAITGELRLDAVLEIAVSTVASLTGAHDVRILLLDAEKSCLVLRASHGCPSQVGERLALGEGLAGWVARHQVPLLLPEIEESDRFSAPARAEGYEGGSFVGLPLLFQERLLGVACAAEKAGGLPFEERDLRVLICLAPYLAIAIRNASIYATLTPTPSPIRRGEGVRG